jgi:hypothetical protein
MLIFLILIIFVSIIFHIKSILAKNDIMSLFDTIFNFLLNYVKKVSTKEEKKNMESLFS